MASISTIGMIARRNKLAFFVFHPEAVGLYDKAMLWPTDEPWLSCRFLWARKQVGMTHLTFKHCALQSSDNML